MRLLAFWRELSTAEKFIHLIPVVCVSLVGLFFVYGDFADSGYIATYTGTGYFVDATQGDDTNPGTRNAPWKTLAKASTATLSSGDALLLKCGEKWRENVSFPTPFAASGTVLIAAYGDCTSAYPTLSGATLVTSTSTSWAPIATSSQIYSFDIDLGTNPAAFFVNNAEMRAARYPNFTDYSHEFLHMASVPSDASTTQFFVSDAERTYLSTHDPVGATVYLREVIYRSDKRTVTAYDSVTGKITVDTPVFYPLRATDGYLFENALWMLDEKNEWYYDSVVKKLYVYFDPALYPDPNAVSVEAVTRGDLLTTPQVTGMRAEHLAFEKGAGDGLRMLGDHSVASDVKANFLYNSGIHIGGNAPSSTVQNATVSYAQQRGIYVESDSSKVANSTVLNTGLGTSAGSSIAGISFENQVNGHFTAQNNVVASSSYLGIGISADGDLIEKNSITNVCVRLSDCGAIYSWNSNGMNAPNKTSQSPSSVKNNSIENVKAASYGSDDGGFGVGVYLDDFVGKVTVQNNTIVNADTGIFLHNGSDNTIASNTIFGSSIWAFSTGQNDYASTTFPMRNNTVSGNTFFLPAGYITKTDGTIVEAPGRAMGWGGGSVPNSFFIGANPNVVTNNTVINIGDKKDIFSVPIVNYASPAYFNQLTPGTVNKRIILPKLFTGASSTPDLIVNGDVGTGLLTPWATYSADTLASAVVATSTWCNASCLLFGTKTTDGILSSNSFTLAASPALTPYEIRYRAKNGTSSSVFSTIVREASNSYGPRGYNAEPVSLVPGEEVFADKLFTSSTTDTIRFDLQVSATSSMYFDDISLKKLDSHTLTDVSSMSKIITNPSASSKQVGCVDLSFASCDLIYDETGYPVEFPVTVAPFSSKIFIEEIPSQRDVDRTNTLPTASTLGTLTPTTNSIHVLWSGPSSFGDAASSTYSLEYRKQGASFWKVQKILTLDSVSADVVGLESGAVYELRLIAHTTSGNSLPSASVFVTMLPTASGGGGGGGFFYGGGGGGGGVSNNPPPMPTTQTTPVPVFVAPPVASAPGAGQAQTVSTFMWRGVNNDDVLHLQNLLIKEKLLSKIEEDGTYGTKTEAAIKKFQCQHKIVCRGSPSKTGWGIVGTKTKNVINKRIAELSGQSGNVTSSQGLFQNELSKGSHNKDVITLQKILIKERLLVTSPDDRLGLFGEKTEKALRDFQCKYKIVCSGSTDTTGWGKTDEKTTKFLGQKLD